jgi:hypothetical protein
MADRDTKLALDIPDLSKLEEHGVSIDAPTPTHFVMADPWAPGENGQAPPSQQQPSSNPPPKPSPEDTD